MRTVYFIIPNFDQRITGGTFYDFQVCKYLKKIYINVKTIVVNHDITSIQLFVKMSKIPSKSIIYMDGYLANKAIHIIKKNKNISLLIHHPCSLEKSNNNLKEPKLYFHEKISFSHAKSIITVSNYMRNVIKRYLNNKVKINIVNPGIDSAFFDCMSNNNSNNILSIGNVIRRKGYLWLIESLKNIDINWHLNIIGHYNRDDRYYNELMSLIKKYQLQDKISFLGNISNENMFEYINNSKLFVLPTYYEGFGMALLESSIAGLKVITTDLPVLREVLRNREVDFIEVNNINSLTIAIKNNLENSFIANKKDNKIQYSWERAAANFSKVMYVNG